MAGTTATLLNLEEALNNTLDLIDQLQNQKAGIEAAIVDLNNRITEAQTMINNNPFLASSGVGASVMQGLNADLSNQQAQLNTVQNNLDAALNQKILDQQAIRDYQIANMTPTELGEFLEVEQEAASGQALAQLKNKIIVAVVVVVFIVGGILIYRWLKKKKNK
jgi:hypothetical protein